MSAIFWNQDERIIKDKSGRKDESTERQKDNTQNSEGFHPNFNELR